MAEDASGSLAQHTKDRRRENMTKNAKKGTTIELKEDEVAIVLGEEGSIQVYSPDMEDNAEIGDKIAPWNMLVAAGIALKITGDPNFVAELMDYASDKMLEAGIEPSVESKENAT